MPPKLSSAQKAEILVEALPYIQRFYDKTIVIKYGGNAMTDAALQEDFAEDVVLLKLVGMNPVVVHGGGPADRRRCCSKLGKQSEFIQGMRVTDEETMDVVEMVLGGLVNQDIVRPDQQGRRQGRGPHRQGRRLHPRAQAARCASKDEPKKKHRHRPGRRDRAHRPRDRPGCCDTRDFIPVIAPLGVGRARESYNINADVVAGKLADVLQGREADAADQHAPACSTSRASCSPGSRRARSTS